MRLVIAPLRFDPGGRVSKAPLNVRHLSDPMPMLPGNAPARPRLSTQHSVAPRPDRHRPIPATTMPFRALAPQDLGLLKSMALPHGHHESVRVQMQRLRVPARHYSAARL